VPPQGGGYGGGSVAAVNTTFSITILTLGFAAFVGGLSMGSVGPRRVALAAGVLYGLGVFLASFADAGLGFLYVTYGLIGGIGIGLGYIVPVATLVNGSRTGAASSRASRSPASAPAPWSRRPSRASWCATSGSSRPSASSASSTS
jgi:hypothetical protein